MCQTDPELERKSRLILDAAAKLEANEWFGPAEDLRNSIPPETVIKRVNEMTDDEEELDRAIPILEELIAQL